MLVKIYFIILLFMFPMYTTADSTPGPQFIVHFEVGENWDESLEPGEQVNFGEHSANLNRLREAGTIVFGARYGEFGMIILNAESLSAAKLLIEADPGVQAGIFDFRLESLMVFYPWQPQ